MKIETKIGALHLAEIVDAWRVFPRLFLTSCFAWSVVVTAQLLYWYMHLPHAERSAETSGFAAVVQVGVLAFTRLVYQTYSAGGRDWSSSTTTVASVTTVEPK